MANQAKNATAPATEGPTAEQKKAAVDALKLVGHAADLMTEILAHEASAGRDPVRLGELETAIYPTVLAGLLVQGNEPDGLDKIRQMIALLEGWDK